MRIILSLTQCAIRFPWSSNLFIVLLAVLLSSLSPAWAGTALPNNFVQCAPSRLDDRWPVGLPIRLCAVRVEFQTDELSGTTGNGTFGSGLPDTLRIDPLPHDKAYFEDHLAFLADYYSTASRGSISFASLDVYPDGATEAYQLAHPMWHYNYNSDTALLNMRLVELFVESMRLAETDIDFTEYDAIILFHAGVGKDFNVGFDNTPFDIPSAYISEDDLTRISGAIPAGVTRGLILPESQNQNETLDLGIELSLNGVMIKLFGNWLGMPDLYNTETGASGIGRWGMMDQGSGNVNAIVPALPDAWSRIYMGWDVPQVIHPSGIGDTVRIGRFGESGTKIVKVPVSGSEYYLLENRDADADSIGFVTVEDRDGRTMHIDRGGNLFIEDGFRVPVRATHYDYGIPGSGILIWHVNEQVIAEGIGRNRVNIDPNRRGVDLVEADGSQDIGREYGFASSGSGTELGIQEDCWFRENRAFRDANGGTVFVRFNDNTRPSARLSDHAYTFLEISDFSSVAPVMTCRIRGTLVERGFPIHVSDSAAHWSAADLDQDGRREVYVQAHDSLFLVADSGAVYQLTVPSGSHLSNTGKTTIEIAKVLTFVGSQIGLIQRTEHGMDSVFRPLPQGAISAEKVFICRDATGATRYVFTGSHLGAVYDENLELLGTIPDSLQYIPNFTYLEIPPARYLIGWDSNSVHRFEISTSLLLQWSAEFFQLLDYPVIVQEVTRSNIFFPGVGYLDAETGELICDVSDCLPPEVDWDGDGRVDGGGVDGAARVPRENFALNDVTSSEVFDLNFDGDPDILRLVVLSNAESSLTGRELVAYDHNTNRFPDFPLAINGDPKLIRLSNSEHRYHIFTEVKNGEQLTLNVMRLPISPEGTVNVVYHAPDNIIVVGPLRPQVHERESFVYVWPNPSNSVANFRLTLPYAARASVSIFDIAGRRIAEVSGSSSAAGAFEIPWKASGVQSGVYIGRVEAIGGGQTHSAEVKIAVVR